MNMYIFITTIFIFPQTAVFLWASEYLNIYIIYTEKSEWLLNFFFKALSYQISIGMHKE